MNKISGLFEGISQVAEGLGLVERQVVLKTVEPELREFYRCPSAEAIQLGREMAQQILAAEARVDDVPEAA